MQVHQEDWFTGSYADRWGGAFLTAQSASPAAAGGMSELTKVGAAPTATPLSGMRPGTGFFAFAVIAAISVGLMAFSTTVRVGPAKASASVGKS